MMLKALPGSILTTAGTAPGGASHVSSDSAREVLSSATSFEATGGRAEANRLETSASRKRILASQSATNAATVVAVDDGASGATATPARSAPRKTAPYAIEVLAQIAMVSPCCM